MMVPLPSEPRTLLPDCVMVLPPNSAEGPPATMVKGSVEVKLKEAGAPPAPRLQMAITGSTMGEEKVMVSVRVGTPPSIATELKLPGGALPTEPPMNVVAGAQEGELVRPEVWPL